MQRSNGVRARRNIRNHEFSRGIDADAAIHHARQAVRLYGSDVDALDGIKSEWTLARVYTLTGPYHEALRQLATTMSKPGMFGPGALRLDPISGPIRNDPRFQEILEQRDNFSTR
ncbi:MAG: hypothetical protein E4H28_03345 [Gemmatimonadales bacterium]|nr:MAG: hypothetical protein E4H28_03345 [Gemmatimonadales bacterium]